MTRRTPLLPFVLALLVALVLAPSATARWAAADSATVHPGVQTHTRGAGQCTSNFVFTDGSDVLLGQAAHCSGTGAATATNGCDAGSLPLGTKVDIDGAERPGTMVYNSWLAMQTAGEGGEEACAYNDLALVRLDQADVDRVNPSVPDFGGPQGTGGGDTGDQVYTYGNSSLRAGVTALGPKRGVVVDRTTGGWSYDVYTATPGIPGDSGSAFLSSDGSALGTLSTVQLAPLAASNGVADIRKELNYARSHGFPGLVLEDGTEPFSPGALGLGD